MALEHLWVVNQRLKLPGNGVMLNVSYNKLRCITFLSWYSVAAMSPSFFFYGLQQTSDKKSLHYDCSLRTMNIFILIWHVCYMYLAKIYFQNFPMDLNKHISGCTYGILIHICMGLRDVPVVLVLGEAAFCQKHIQLNLKCLQYSGVVSLNVFLFDYFFFKKRKNWKKNFAWFSILLYMYTGKYSPPF